MSSDFPRQTPPPENERTIVRPRPGGRSPASVPVHDAGAGADEEIGRYAGGNALLRCAQPLLALVPQLRASAEHPDPAALRESLSEGVREFERAAQRADVSREATIAARYILCTFLDETAASTPWGSDEWAHDSLLVRFHNESWGGEKVFALLSKLAENPSKNRELLELIYACLALGFEGRYRVLDNGRAQLDELRERLYLMLRSVQPAPERTLSPRWAPAVIRQRRWLSATPFWAVGAAVALLAVGVYFALSLLLATRSDPVFASVHSIRLPAAAPLPVQPPASRPRLAQFLEPEIREGLVSVRDELNKSVVTIKGDGFFAPGSAEVSGRVVRVVERIGQALLEHPGKVLVSGHTDSVPIRTARFPSNWHLSQERAQSVQAILARVVPANRLQAEGRAESEPVDSNETAQGRERNRRVEITLFSSSR